jgi:hypothetical protein
MTVRILQRAACSWTFIATSAALACKGMPLAPMIDADMHVISMEMVCYQPCC